jgi:hypothetical protein
MKTIAKITVGTSLFATALLLLPAPCNGQHAHRTPDQIIRQAQAIQDRQQAIQQITQDFAQRATDIVNIYQQQKEDERIERQRQREAEAAERRDRDQDNSNSNQDNQ